MHIFEQSWLLSFCFVVVNKENKKSQKRMYVPGPNMFQESEVLIPETITGAEGDRPISIKIE